LPQIAARAQHHLRVVKFDQNGVTVTQVAPLDKAARVQELAIMLSGNPPTEGAIQNAKELLGS
jgi:DNA repair protein RecN (Recombination protein N)